MTVAKPQADGIAGIVLTLSPVPRIVDTRESTVPNGYKSAYGVLEVGRRSEAELCDWQ